LLSVSHPGFPKKPWIGSKSGSAQRSSDRQVRILRKIAIDRVTPRVALSWPWIDCRFDCEASWYCNVQHSAAHQLGPHVPIRSRFRAPNPISGAPKKLHWSVSKHSLLLLMLSSYFKLTPELMAGRCTERLGMLAIRLPSASITGHLWYQRLSITNSCMYPGIAPCVIKPVATTAATDQSHSPAPSAVA
jgi:hypothetical protein